MQMQYLSLFITVEPPVLCELTLEGTSVQENKAEINFTSSDDVGKTSCLLNTTETGTSLSYTC